MARSECWREASTRSRVAERTPVIPYSRIAGAPMPCSRADPGHEFTVVSRGPSSPRHASDPASRPTGTPGDEVSEGDTAHTHTPRDGHQLTGVLESVDVRRPP